MQPTTWKAFSVRTRPRPSKKKVNVGVVPFTISDPEDAVARVLGLIHDRSGLSIRLSNSYCVALASKDPDYQALLAGDGLNFADGLPVALCTRYLSHAMDSKRVRGPSLFVDVLDRGREHGVNHFFLGATAATLSNLNYRVEKRFQGIRLAGSYAPPFGPVDDDFVSIVSSKISGSGADVVWVALGTPKQDFAAERLAKALNIPCIGVGAAFDFVAGTVPEAPTWMQRYGLEWLFRFASEPSRLWRRYTVGNAIFLWSVIRQHVIGTER